MKGILILMLVLGFATAVFAQETEYPAAVFAYTQEIQAPFTWEGIGTDQLIIIDAIGARFVFYPRPSIEDAAFTEFMANRPAYSQAELDSMTNVHTLHVRALRIYRSSGAEAMIREYLADSTVSRVETIAPGEFKVVFKNGSEEYLEYARSHHYVPKTRAEVHQKLIDDFNASRDRGATIWFGTSHYIHSLADDQEIDEFREAIRLIEAGVTLSPEQELTPAGRRGVKFDASSHE